MTNGQVLASIIFAFPILLQLAGHDSNRFSYHCLLYVWISGESTDRLGSSMGDSMANAKLHPKVEGIRKNLPIHSVGGEEEKGREDWGVNVNGRPILWLQLFSVEDASDLI